MKSIIILLLILNALINLPAQAIEVAFEEDPRLPIVYLNVALKKGAVHDPEGQSGITRFMSEMLLRGTAKKLKKDLDLALDQLGAKLEAETQPESVLLRGAVLSSELDRFLDLLTEIITEPSFDLKEMMKLKSETVSAIMEELGNDRTLGVKRFESFLFQGHPYGNPVMGVSKDVEHFSREQLNAHYERVFQEKDLLIVGTGHARPEQLNAWGEKLALLRPNRPEAIPEARLTTPAQPDTMRLLIIDKPDRTQTQINVGQVGLKMTDPDYFPIYLGNHAFGGGSFSARLMVEIRVKRGWSYGAYSFFRHGTQPKSWQYWLFPALKDTPQALETSLSMLSDLKEKGITQEEFDFAQRSLINSAGFRYNTPKKRVENKLIERTLGLPDGFMKSFDKQLSEVTLNQVNTALNKFIEPDHIAIAVVGTAKGLREKLAQTVKMDPEQVKVVKYTTE